MANTFGDKISRFGGSIKQKTQSIAETASLNAQIAADNKQLGELFEQLGKSYYELHAADAEEALAAQCGRIAEIQTTIEENRQRIVTLKGIKTCPACGAEAPLNAAFCSTCGAALPTPEEPIDTTPCCPQCGVTLAEGARFCTACGVKIGGEEA